MDLDRLMDRFRGPLVGLLVSWGASWSEADDLARSVFTEAWLGRERFRGEFESDRDVGAWLRGIARNLHNADRRDGERRAAQSLELASEVAAKVGDSNSDTGGESASLLELLPLLGEEYATVLRLRYLEDSTVAQVAGLLGLSEKATEGRLYRARKALKAMLVEREA